MPPREDPRMQTLQTFNIADATGMAATLLFATSPSKKNAIFFISYHLTPRKSQSWLTQTRPLDYSEKNSVFLPSLLSLSNNNHVIIIHNIFFTSDEI